MSVAAKKIDRRRSTRGPINTVEIKVWMLRKGVTQKMLAEKLQVHFADVGNAIHGRKAHLRVYEALKNMGCPKKYLGEGNGFNRKDAKSAKKGEEE